MLQEDDIDDPVEWVYARAEELGLTSDRFHELLAKAMGLAHADHARRRLNDWKSEGRRPWDDSLRALAKVLLVDPSVVQIKFAQETYHRAALYIREITPRKDVIFEQMCSNLAREGWDWISADRGQGCTHPTFNHDIVNNQPIISLKCLPDRWLASTRCHDDLVHFVHAERRRKTGIYRNDRKIRIASDFIGQSTVDIQETDYLSSLMTDQFGWDRIRSTKVRQDLRPHHILRDVDSFVDIKTSHLRGFGGENRISNQLGASTLAFSNDGYLMIVLQNNKNLQSQNLLAPSGSGSLDWADITASAANDLLSLVRYGGERELREECALGDDNGRRIPILSKVMVTGFVRMLHRAGKPEFFCLGYIDAPAKEIHRRKPERYVDRVDQAPVEQADWSSIRPQSEIARVCGAYLNARSPIPLSYPLEHALKLLIELCENGSTGPVLGRFVHEASRRHAG